MKKILLTGFGPFGDYQFNPTEKSALDFDGMVLGDRQVYGRVLPCTYYAFKEIADFLEKERPYAVVSIGLFSSVQGLQIEPEFHNLMQSKYADNDGFAPQGLPIVEDGPYSLKNERSSNRVLNALMGHGMPAHLSTNVEHFICNSLAYQTAAAIAANKLQTKHVFIHIPWTTYYIHRIALSPEKMFLSEAVYYESLKVAIKTI